MKIYNTLSKKKEEFIPIEEGKVRMYVCGPTVYNLIHIGNARPMIVFDTVRRYMEHKGYDVNYVSNFTDVDDKIIKKAMEEGVDASVISKRYIEECKKDMAAMNVRPATTHPLATNEIDGMLDMIEVLVEKAMPIRRRTEPFISGHAILRSMESFPIRIWMICREETVRCLCRGRIRRRIPWTLCSGNRRRMGSLTGNRPGATGGPAGISNAL